MVLKNQRSTLPHVNMGRPGDYVKLFSLLLVGGCVSPVDDGYSSDAIYLLDDDHQAVVGRGVGGVTTTLLGAAPGRLARVGGSLWVTLPTARGIAVLEERLGADGVTLERVDTLETGAAPMGIAVNSDASRIYLALSTSNEVQELDSDGNRLRHWPIDGEPTWIALHPDGTALYVGSAFGGHVSWIDLESGGTHHVTLPATSRRVRPEGAAVGKEVKHTPRITGDLAVSPDGTLLAIPVLMVDRETPVDAPENDSGGTNKNGYGSPDQSGNDVWNSRMSPVIALVPLHGGEPAGLDAELRLAVGFSREEVVHSYLSGTTFSPDGDLVLATMEASAAVVAIAARTDRVQRNRGFTLAEILMIETRDGPRSLMFSGSMAYVDSFLDRTIDQFSLDDVRSEIGTGVSVRATIADRLDASPLETDLRAGRTLFYSAANENMAATGAGVSCSTCHLSGRNDGLTWILEDGPRQTPSLVGGIAATAPFTWASQVDTVEDEVEITSEGRMGGNGLTSRETKQVALYLESLRAPDSPLAGSVEPAVIRGAALFWRSDVGCASCHYGDAFTDNQHWPLFEMDAVNTPSLRGVAATAPYLHDGRALTLRGVLSLAVGGDMGDTSMLSVNELDDLEAYLRSL